MRASALVPLLVITLVFAASASTAYVRMTTEGVIDLSGYDWLLLDSSAGRSFIEYTLSPIRTSEGSTARYHAEFYLAISQGSVTVSVSGKGWVGEELIIDADSVSVGGTEYPILADAGIKVAIDAWEGWVATAKIMYPDGALAYAIDLGSVPSDVGEVTLRIEASGRAIFREVSSYATDTSHPTMSPATYFYIPRYIATIPVPGGYAGLVEGALLLYINGSFACRIDLENVSGAEMVTAGLVLTETPQVWWVTKMKEVTYWAGIIDPSSCGLTGVVGVNGSQLPGRFGYGDYVVKLWDSVIYVYRGGTSLIFDTSAGEVLNSSTGLDYLASDAEAGIAVLSGSDGTQVIVRDGRDVVLPDVSAAEAAIADGRVLLLPREGGSELLVTYLNGTVKDMDFGYSARIWHIASARDSFAAIAYNSTVRSYILLIMTPDGRVAHVIPLSDSGAFAFGPSNDGAAFASVYGGRLNLSIIDSSGIRTVFSYPSPPLTVGSAIPGWGGMVLRAEIIPYLPGPGISVYVDGGGMHYIGSTVSVPSMLRPIGDRIYWAFQSGVVSFGKDSIRYYPWSGYRNNVWWVGDRAVGAWAGYIYDPDQRKYQLIAFYDTFTPPSNVVSRNVTMDLEGYCSEGRAPDVGPGPSAPTIAIRERDRACIGVPGKYLHVINVSSSDYGLTGVWGVGDLTVAIFTHFYNYTKHLLVIASPDGVRELNLTEMLMANLLTLFDTVNVSKIGLTPLKSVLSPDGERIAIEMRIDLYPKFGSYSIPSLLSLYDTLVVDSEGNAFFASPHLGLSRVLNPYPVGWLSPTELVVGNPPATMDLSGGEPEAAVSYPGPMLSPESLIVPYQDGFLAASSPVSSEEAEYSLPVIITANGSRYPLTDTYLGDGSTFAELLPLGSDSFALVELGRDFYYIAGIYDLVTDLGAVSPSRLIIGPDASLTLDCYGDCEAVITSPGGDERTLQKGEKTTLSLGVRYTVRVGGEEYEVMIPVIASGELPPPEGVEGVVTERRILEGSTYCPSTIWAEFGRRVEVYDSGNLAFIIPYPDSSPLRELLGERCLQPSVGTHLIVIAYRDTSGRIVEVEALNVTVLPATGTLAPIGSATATTTTTSQATTTTTATAMTTTTAAETTTTTTQPHPGTICPDLWVCILIILVILLLLALIYLWRRKRKKEKREE